MTENCCKQHTQYKNTCLTSKSDRFGRRNVTAVTSHAWLIMRNRWQKHFGSAKPFYQYSAYIYGTDCEILLNCHEGYTSIAERNKPSDWMANTSICRKAKHAWSQWCSQNTDMQQIYVDTLRQWRNNRAVGFATTTHQSPAAATSLGLRRLNTGGKVGNVRLDWTRLTKTSPANRFF